MSSHTLVKVAAPEDAVPHRIVPRRRPGQWAAAGIVLVLLGLAVNSVVRNEAFQWDVVGDYFTSASVLRGLWLTLWLTALVMALGFALGALLAAFRLSANPVLRAVSWGYVWLFRSMPILVQLLFWFNIGALYPTILGVKTVNLLGPVTVAIIGLTLHEAARSVTAQGDYVRSVVIVLLSVSSQWLGGPAAGHAVAGRGGFAVGQPAKRQPSLLGGTLGRGVWSLMTRGRQHRTYQVTKKVRIAWGGRCAAGGSRARARWLPVAQRLLLSAFEAGVR
ncbi:His/Glu/Gln/Arg/opine family amino acid ABC transporter permease subunit [Streptomyces phaeochromogenes]|jgi:His/Glu/Gln/Arg/opine family amino acid ABC transporter permease subunit|uniref:ABC transporter permease subunit n=1 Tax=Streptomyces phaeochromogenes TaxID=1923 RepID=UPI00279424A3|nr:ABC transporter permease subunit [Streptomyces phaeochromogenes]MDQ0953610.1 His/Glu/Gln/Arg/opine family amino acid ABC transporter permease subunit [Streptomyces phaeochromogenes]